MSSTSEARLKYFEGIKAALLAHLHTTEAGLRKLEGVKPKKIEKVIADLQRDHKKLLRRIDRQIERERAR